MRRHCWWWYCRAAKLSLGENVVRRNCLTAKMCGKTVHGETVRGEISSHHRKRCKNAVNKRPFNGYTKRHLLTEKKSCEATGDRTQASQLKVQHSNTWAIQEITDDQLNNRKEFETKLDNSLVHWTFRFPNGLILTKSCRSLQEICGILVCIKFQKLLTSMQDPILTFSAGWNILLDAAENLRDFYFWINFQKWISSIKINQINYFPAMFWGHSILQKRSKLGPICIVGT